MWFNFAASQGNKNAEESLDRVNKEMEPSQIDNDQIMALGLAITILQPGAYI